MAWHGVCAAQSNDLPDFGSPADTILNKSKERQLGSSVMLQLRNSDAIVDDPLLTEYVQILGARLASQANNGDHSFNFFAVDDDGINAFALPGGYVGVNTGLITASENESELAGVLAHEVSHVTQRHIARSIYDNQKMSIFSIASMLAAVLLGATTDMSSDAMQGLLLGGQAAAAQRRINFTRSNGHEADRIGIEVLSAAGFDPNGMSSFFEKLSRRYGISRQFVPEMLQTHPVTSRRVAEARSRARQLPPARNVDSMSYGLAKARIKVLNAPTAEAALAIFDPKADSLLPADRYGRALVLMELSRSDESERLFRGLVEEFPAVIAFRIGHAEAMMASGFTDLSLELYEEAAGLFPRNVPTTISYAEALIDTGRPAEAHRILLDLLNNVRPTPAQIQLIARAANAEGDVANSQYYMAEYFLSVGNLMLAIRQIRLALEAPDANAVDRARFEAKLKRWIDFLPDEDDRRRSRDGRDDRTQKR